MKAPSLNQNQIKYIAIVAMVIDHIAWVWLPLTSPLAQGMHFIGRLTGPTMAYFLVEGYLHTRSVKRYAMRLGIFALVSWPAMTLFEYGRLPIVRIGERTVVIPVFGVIYTLFLCLLAVWLWDSKRIPLPVRLLGVAGLCWLSRYGDWAYYDVLFAMIFFVFRDRPKVKWLAYCTIVAVEIGLFLRYMEPFTQLCQLGQLMVPLVLALCYNGEGGSRNPAHKWFFYIFYPAHMLVLAALTQFGGLY